MKKLFIFTSLILCFLNVALFDFSTTKAAAEVGYMRVMTEDAVFFSSDTMSTDSALFLLPRGYFVKVISKTEQKVYCEFADSSSNYSKILGYVELKNLKDSEGIFPIYPKIQITSLTNAPIYSRPSSASKVVLSVFEGQNLAFYGYSVDREFMFVLIGSDFGFIPTSSVETPAIPSHPLPLPTPIPTPKPSSLPTDIPPLQAELPQTMQILLVAFIFIPVILLSILIFKK